MATTVGQHSVAAFTSPVNGTTPIDANTVRGNDNTVRVAYVDHDADPGIHVQSSTLASRPVAGTAGRKWITEDSGIYTLWFDDGTNWHPVSSENINLTVLATENLVKGDVVKVTGWNNGQDLAEVAKVSSASDVAFAIMTAAVSQNTMGYATNTGIVQDLATDSFSVGNILYPNTSGGLTATKPTSGNYQPCAYVLRSNANNGVLYVEFSAPRIVERSDNTASTIVLRDASGNFSAGTITAGAVTSTGLVTFASLKGTGATTVTNIINDGTMATASATTLATSSSIKTYVDSQVATVDTLAEVLANGNTTGANDIIVTAGQKITTNTIDETTSGSGVTIDSVLLKDDVVNATDIETGTISANDGTQSATIANSTGVMTIASSVLTTTDINGGTIDGTTIGGSSAAAGTFTTVGATTGNITTVNATTVDATSVEVTNVKAKDGTASITIADSTGALTLSSALADSNLATISTAGKVANSATTATSANTNSAIVARDSSGNFSAGTITANLTGNISGTAPAGTLTGTTLASNVVSSSLTSVGTLTSLTVSGDLTVDTSTLKVDSTNNRVGIGTSSPAAPLDVVGIIRNDGSNVNLVKSGTTGTTDINFADASSADVGQIRYDHTSNFMRFGVNDAERMRIDSAGNLGLGTTTTSYARLTSAGTIRRTMITSGTSASPSEEAGLIYDDASVSSNRTGIYFFNTYTSAGNSWMSFKTTKTEVAAERMLLDADGNLGLGVTPSAWSASFKAFQLSGLGALWGSSTAVFLSNNTYNDGSNKYIGNGLATRYYQSTGQHIWENAVNNTGGAGAAATLVQAMTLDASGNLGVGETSPANRLHIKGANTAARGQVTVVGDSADARLTLYNGTTFLGTLQSSTSEMTVGAEANIPLRFITNGSERARITSGGDFFVRKTSSGIANTGFEIKQVDANTPVLLQTTPGYYTAAFNRTSDDGDIILFYQDGTQEGSISVSNNTVSYNAFAGSHWSQLEDGSKPEILRGTVMEALNDLCEWPGEQNERLPKCKISDTAGSKKVYGVFMDWDNDWTETNDLYVTAVGAFICRISADVTVEQGDLLESNGDGTARVQADDVIRSSTIGKVTSTVQTHQYEDGTYCVPVVLYCG